MPTIAIQTPLYRSSIYLPILVQSLKAQTHADWVFYACENSGDAEERRKVYDFLAKSGIPHHLSESEVNLGFADGHNALLAMHDHEFVLLLNEDAYLDPHHLERCLDRFSKDPACASLTGIVYRWTAPPDQMEPLNDRTLIDTVALEYRCLSHVIDVGAGRTRGEMLPLLSDARRVWGVSGAVSMFRRSLFSQADPNGELFYPGFFMYKEDVDLAIRLRRKGYSAWFDPSIVSYHRRSVKAVSGIGERIREERKRPVHLRVAMYRNQWRIYINHLSWGLGVGDLARSVVHECIHGLFVFLVSPSVFFSAWKQILLGWGACVRRSRALRSLGLHDTRLRI